MSDTGGNHIAIVGVDRYGYMECFEDDLVITKARALNDGHIYITNTRGCFQVGTVRLGGWRLYTVKDEFFSLACKDAEDAGGR